MFNSTSISVLQLQANMAALEAALGEVKEYKEDWRKTPVLRQGGRFVSKGESQERATVDREHLMFGLFAMDK